MTGAVTVMRDVAQRCAAGAVADGVGEAVGAGEARVGV